MNYPSPPTPPPQRGEGSSGTSRRFSSPSPLAGEGGPRARQRVGGRGDDPYPTSKQLRERAKAMRHVPTEAERHLWRILRAKRLENFKFKRQVPIDSYIADFICFSRRLIIEADGGHHGSDIDEKRDAYLRSQGFRILRFWNNEVLNNEEGVAETILSALQQPLSPTPLPRRGEGL